MCECVLIIVVVLLTMNVEKYKEVQIGFLTFWQIVNILPNNVQTLDCQGMFG